MWPATTTVNKISFTVNEKKGLLLDVLLQNEIFIQIPSITMKFIKVQIFLFVNISFVGIKDDGRHHLQQKPPMVKNRPPYGLSTRPQNPMLCERVGY